MTKSAVRQVTMSDVPDICRIYNHYIAATTITFEETPVSNEEMASRITNVSQRYPWLVYEDVGSVVGYTYATRWKERSAYRYSVEAGIYIASDCQGRGIGTMLATELIAQLRARSIHSIICGIALPNPASIALCERLGFQQVAHFKEVGFKLSKWVDVGYWELVL